MSISGTEMKKIKLKKTDEALYMVMLLSEFCVSCGI